MDWKSALDRWLKAGLIDGATADRIRAYEAEHAPAHGLNRSIIVALALGAITLSAGILLFVSAHWDTLSPAERFTLVLSLTAIFHLGGAFSADRFSKLATTLHFVGTIALGAGIFLSGQIFNMEEHWPAGIMLWALGAWIAWAVLENWSQALLAALLTPAWVSGEWAVFADSSWAEKILAHGWLLLVITYLSARTGDRDTLFHRGLSVIGAVMFIPFSLIVMVSAHRSMTGSPTGTVAGWAPAFALPTALAFFLRGPDAWRNLLAVPWVIVLGMTEPRLQDLFPYAWCALGAVALVAWGVAESHRARIDLGMACFSLTIVTFYFSNVMDKLDRSLSLIGLGILFLGGGWALHRTRRILVARLQGAAS